ncbi:MAG: hypothetical protein A2Y48_08420 [Nitrospirae bacterium RIFCSPLOW2_12_42_9]|nr:MAG: hypothetical protein A2Y48_08420 [Nitrospirae bacterium RIFCSPLOW2_12_42_9]
MSQNDNLSPLLVVLRDLVEWLKASHTPGVVIGGVAASVLGRPRFTQDVDALVLLDNNDWAEFLSSGTQLGFVTRISNALDFATKNRILLLRHESSGIDVDISLGVLPFEEEAVSSAMWVEVGGVKIPLPPPEDLIIMKAVARRPRDIVDIESIMDANPNLNVGRIKMWVREFSSVLEMPEILTDLEAILSHKRKKKL